MTYNPVAAKEIDDERQQQDFEARSDVAQEVYKRLTYGTDMGLTAEVITNEAVDHRLIEALMWLHKTDGGNANAIRAVIDAVEAGFHQYADREAGL